MSENAPPGFLTIRTVAMPGDLNPDGDVFGGWLLAQMDLAGGLAARHRANGRVATVAVEAMEFHVPVQCGDLVSFYSEEMRVGRTSLTFRVSAWLERRDTSERILATHGSFTFVAIGPDRKPRPVPPAEG